MKLLRFGPKGQEKPGVLDDQGHIRDISALVPDLDARLFTDGGLDAIRAADLSSLPKIDGTPRIGACFADVPNFFCIGLNYTKHAIETGMEPPKEPIIFSKATSCLSGPNDPVIIPRGSEKTDWEVELGVVIGKSASYVAHDDALDYVAGYCVINDVSERSFQIERGGQWIKGKSAPSFGPVGPWFVTADEIPDPQNLNLSLSLNGQVVQNSNTDDMIFTVREIISHMSQFMELRPGDIIATGTPSGVGMGMKPQRFLRPGDVMELTVAGLGTQTQTAQAAE